MTKTNIVLRVVGYTYSKPSITVELDMSNRNEALSIADKLNDIAKAKGEDTTIYFVETIDIPEYNKDSDDEIPF